MNDTTSASSRNTKKHNPWFRMYSEAIDDEKLLLLAFEDRWHFVTLLCCKNKGILDDGPIDLIWRKVAVKAGLDLRSLEEVARRLAEVGLIDQKTLQPLAWESRQFQSDSSRLRVAAFRERKKNNDLHDEAVTPEEQKRPCNVTVTVQETDTDTDKEKDSSQTSGEVRTASAPNCPYEKLTELYREHFPDQRQPRTDISDRRKAIMRKGWMHASRLRKRDGSGLLYNGDPTGLTFWDGFMSWIAKHCEFCMTEQTNFDIEWLFTPRAIDNLIDGKYTAVRERKRA